MSITIVLCAFIYSTNLKSAALPLQPENLSKSIAYAPDSFESNDYYPDNGKSTLNTVPSDNSKMHSNSSSTHELNSLTSSSNELTENSFVVEKQGLLLYNGNKLKNSVPRKGVGDLKPSIVARKGVDYNATDPTPVDFTSLSTKPQGPTFLQQSLVNEKAFTTVPIRMPSDDIPLLFLTDVDKQLSEPLKPVPVGAVDPKNLKHLKPLAAVDDVANKTFDSTPVIIGVTVGISLILVLAIVAYKKLQDVWSRRHYDRMDFLVDGMYDF